MAAVFGRPENGMWTLEMLTPRALVLLHSRGQVAAEMACAKDCEDPTPARASGLFSAFSC